MNEKSLHNRHRHDPIGKPAPEWQVSEWLNTGGEDISLAALRGRVVVIEAFQMLCPGCVSHGLPQARSVQDLLPLNEVVVIGLHTVFEHHSANSRSTLAAFLHEYRLDFPVAIDRPGKQTVPLTMQAYQMKGTPTLNIIDQSGILRAQHFGPVSDLQLGYELAAIQAQASTIQTPPNEAVRQCDDQRCPLDPP